MRRLAFVGMVLIGAPYIVLQLAANILEWAGQTVDSLAGVFYGYVKAAHVLTKKKEVPGDEVEESADDE